MMKKRIRRLLALVSSAILLVAITVGVTVAYLTDSKQVTNTFTVGNVRIELDEAQVNEYGEPKPDADRTKEGNIYRLIPGHTYTKDPTVTVLENSENCYVRMKVQVDGLDALKDAFPTEKYSAFYSEDVFLLQQLWAGDNSSSTLGNGWVYTDFTNDTYEFRYANIVMKNTKANTKLSALFASFTIPSTLTNEQIASLEGVKFFITAEAIQADGFENADDAWTAFTPAT